ncbi:hypothetical protein BASA81_007857 [Batrachochytrium salamandrivorans]|nr:hypothetical protein BASA81_007857 [Batrachochytrium salamandrivorans]
MIPTATTVTSGGGGGVFVSEETLNKVKANADGKLAKLKLDQERKLQSELDQRKLQGKQDLEGLQRSADLQVAVETERLELEFAALSSGLGQQTADELRQIDRAESKERHLAAEKTSRMFHEEQAEAAQWRLHHPSWYAKLERVQAEHAEHEAKLAELKRRHVVKQKEVEQEHLAKTGAAQQHTLVVLGCVALGAGLGGWAGNKL